MTAILDGVRDHYRATGLTERLKAALAAFGPEEQLLLEGRLGILTALFAAAPGGASPGGEVTHA